MTKNSLFKIIAIAFLLFILVGLLFFRKGDDKVLNPNLVPANNQQAEEPDEKYELTEKEKVKIFAENFVTTYYSYIWGNFSNMESQYYYMTEEMKKREENKVEKTKREIEGQPQRYFTTQARITNYSFVEYQENKTSLDIEIEIREFNGAYVIDSDVPEIKPHTTALVDGNKKVYLGNIEDLIIKTTDKSVQINLIKTDDKWKVNWIGEK